MAGTAGLSVALVRVGWAAAWSAGFRVQGSGFRVQGLSVASVRVGWKAAWGAPFRVQGSGFKVKNFELWVKCSGLGLRTYI
jgi:hypothetical protein